MKMAKTFIERVLNEMVVPYVAESIRATEKYDRNPSIVNGARRKEAKDKLHAAIQDATEYLLIKYHALYSDKMTQREFEEIMDDVIRNTGFEIPISIDFVK